MCMVASTNMTQPMMNMVYGESLEGGDNRSQCRKLTLPWESEPLLMKKFTQTEAENKQTKKPKQKIVSATASEVGSYDDYHKRVSECHNRQQAMQESQDGEGTYLKPDGNQIGLIPWQLGQHLGRGVG